MAELYKTRTYTALYYPKDGDLTELLEFLKNRRLPFIVSPIHSADVEHAKPHVHFMIDYPSPVVITSAHRDYHVIAANGFIEPVRSRKAMMRYFLHLDDSDKEQLSASDIITGCGAVFDTTPELTADDILRIKLEIQDFCRETQITEYADLCHTCSDYGKLDWYRVVTSNTIHFRAYFASLRHK
jgi:hypothetical protein